jgi:methyl-accepting chemotaxis protein/methyl-accepting chemotaxis protein-1 (serine sensor receptor)
MNIGKKLVVTCGGLILVMVLVGAVSIYNLSALNRMTQQIITDPLPGMAGIARVQAAALTVRGDVWRYMAEPDASVRAALEPRIDANRNIVREGLQTYEATITTEEDRALFEQLKPAVQRYKEALPEVLELSRAGKTDEARAKYDAEAAPAFEAVNKLLQAEADLNRTNGEKMAAASQQTYSKASSTLWTMLLLCSLGGLATAAYIIRNLNRSLRQTAAELSQGAEQLASAAAQVSASSQSLAQGSSQQAASLEETSASSEEVNSMARQNTEHTGVVASLMTASRERFDATHQSLAEMEAAMGQIDASSGKIYKIIKVIDEIAFQTNILALNAAVEAARAGQSGLGFAVVAEEVRTLAQRCAQAAKDTAVLIEESINTSKDGKAKVDQVAAAIGGVSEIASKVGKLVADVHQGSQEQTRGIEQIAGAITQMEKVTQSAAASAEESAAASEELTAQSQRLREIVEQLAAMVGGRRSTRGGGSPSSGLRAPALLRRVAASVGNKPDARTAEEALPLEEEFREF